MDTITFIWAASLGIGVVVLLVVAFLLNRIRNTAKQIDDAAAVIWTQGKMVANNTIQIPLFLTTTNQVVDRILAAAVDIINASDAIEKHAEGCPGCPACQLS